MPKVSIVLPTYNQARYLKKAISSVLLQSFPDFELIIVNDGSTDNTEQVIKNFNDKRIIYIKQKNQGEYKSTNKALRMIRGDYFTWIHSDDLWPKNNLKNRVEFLNKHRFYKVVHGDICLIDAYGRRKKILRAKPWDNQKILAYYCQNYYQGILIKRPVVGIFHHTSLLMKKDVLKSVGFWDEKLPYAGDLDWMLRLLKKEPVIYLNKVVYYYRVYSKERHTNLPRRQIVLSILKRICKK